MFDQLAQVLGGRKKEVVFIPNVGNAGDLFIAHATYQFFDRIGLQYRFGNLQGTYPGAVVVCPGGGAMIEPYQHLIEFLRRNLNKWDELIVLPHTIRSYGDFLGELKGNSYLFCREAPSYEYAKTQAPAANVFLAEDLAFSCKFEETERQVAVRTPADIARFLLNLRRNVRLRKRLIADNRLAKSITPPFNAFRTDIEKTDIRLPPGNVDLSWAFGDDSMLPPVALHTTYRMMHFLAQLRSIRTNRLHVGIMSAMLGLETDLYDNNYGKNRSIFEHSIRGRYPNVRWHTEPPSL